MTKIINLYGGPCVGKTSSASFIHYLLKSRDINAELVREFVKGRAYDGMEIGPYDQFYFFGKQSHYESKLYNKVDWIVTDSPVALCTVYAKKYNSPEVANGVVEASKAFYKQSSSDGHEHINVLLERTKKYQQTGRFESEEEARVIDKEVEIALVADGLIYRKSTIDETSLRNLISQLLGE